MKPLLFTTAGLLGLATSVHANTDYSSMIAEMGLSATADQLSAIAAPTPSDQFALGGTRFLMAVEQTLQTRYKYGINEGISDMLDIPLMRLPIFDNPAPLPFAPDVIATVFEDALVDFDVALSALDTIADDDDVQVTINTNDLWFDVNANSTRDAGEGMFQLLSGELDPQITSEMALTVTFDTADAAWLSAYAHLLSGVSQTVLAFDPSEAVGTVLAGTAQLAVVNSPNRIPSMIMTPEDETFADAIAIFIRAIEGQPDIARSRAAHAHFMGMIADNQVFWSRVAAETDDHNEWIPNKNQTSVLPFPFPAETGQRWRQVLADGEALLRGDALIPHWRLDENVGLNLYELMQNPPVIDVIGIIQGYTVAPYAETGRRIDGQNLRAFEQLVGGDAPLFMVILN